MNQYFVLSRKYRPAFFSEIVGQPHIVQTLTNALRHNRLGHAFLFSGPRGVGKTTTARILAKALNCVQGPGEEPCNQCEFCLEITTGNAIDVFEIDGASNNSVDDVRSIRENVQYHPSKARYKIYIIDEVHMLSTSAFNALLKTLEEPPPHIVFMFATTEVHKIPITIVSRCQHFEFKLLSVKDIMTSCQQIIGKEKVSVTQPALRMIARAAEGSLRDSQSILDQVINVADETIDINHVKFVLGSGDPTLLNKLLTAITAGDLAAAFITIETIAATGYDLYQLCKDLITIFRNLMMIKIVEKPLEIVDLTADELKELKSIAGTTSYDHLEYGLITLAEMENTIKRSINPRFILETVVARISRYAQLVPVQTILKKLDRLEKSLAADSSTSVQASPPATAQSASFAIPIPPPDEQTPKKKPQKNPSSEPLEEEYSPHVENVVNDLEEPPASSPPSPEQKNVKTDLPQLSPAPAQRGIEIKAEEYPVIQDSEVKKTWQNVVLQIMKEKRSLATILENLFLLAWHDHELVLGIREDDSLASQVLDDKKNQILITNTVAMLTQAKPRLVIQKISHTHKAYSIIGEQQFQAREKMKHLETIALKEPLIQHTIDLFEGKISNITEKTNKE
ncbi:DNA polymerase III subunit gamma/tau [candidate division CSSED10-310 bacterium]|uniref:DNA polymerase III subunit gamma/tau n=1 Tax=candidate division CSSED10-310 bacterium TaxID=2855610 RepID=A0ABV6Z537_UNCC1